MFGFTSVFKFTMLSEAVRRSIRDGGSNMSKDLETGKHRKQSTESSWFCWNYWWVWNEKLGNTIWGQMVKSPKLKDVDFCVGWSKDLLVIRAEEELGKVYGFWGVREQSQGWTLIPESSSEVLSCRGGWKCGKNCIGATVRPCEPASGHGLLRKRSLLRIECHDFGHTGMPTWTFPGGTGRFCL